MKRKLVNAAKRAQSTKNGQPAKIGNECVSVKESDDMEEVPVKEVNKLWNKKADKIQKIVYEPVLNAVDEKEIVEQGDRDDEEGDEEDEEMKGKEDHAPSEKIIGTEEPSIPSKVKSGPIPPTVPATKVVHIYNLPKKCKQIDIVEVFRKYGEIDQIHTVTTPDGTSAEVAYKTEKAALAALADDKQVKVIDTFVSVSTRNEEIKTTIDLNRDRCVHVKNIKTGTTLEQIKEHFQSCGEVENVKLVTKSNATYVYVTFTEKSSIPAALKLHNSILNDANIRVIENTESGEAHVFDVHRTVMVRNKQNFKSIEAAKLEAIFTRCGEIDFILVLCKKQMLAFITFKTEESVQKALKLSGETQQEVKLEIESYSPTRNWTSIYVINLPKDCTEADLTRHFSKAGEIANIILKRCFAIIRFNDSDGYCKSFLYNESFIKGQIIFIQPHSTCGENEDAEIVEDEDDDDEAPSDGVIGTEETTIQSEVKSGPIPPTVPITKVVHINNLYKKCKQIDIVKVCAKYGAIDQIHIDTSSDGTSAKVAYKSEKAALAAAADIKQVNIDLNRDRCVHVKNIRTGTTQEQMKEHFEPCGEVESVKLVTKRNSTYAYVTFTDKSAIPAALKLHNSILNNANIRVIENTENRAAHGFDECSTVMVRNKQNFESIEVAKLEAIFSKCGEIGFLEVVCRRQVLAFVTFKNEEAARNALKLSGETQQDVELEIEPYSPTKKWTSILVTNLPSDCTEADLTNHFSKAGEIANIILNKRGFAIIRFNDSNGYCKSFLYNESFIKGEIVFIEPQSMRKNAVLKNKPFQKKGLKRPLENGHSIFKAKTIKQII